MVLFMKIAFFLFFIFPEQSPDHQDAKGHQKPQQFLFGFRVAPAQQSESVFDHGKQVGNRGHYEKALFFFCPGWRGCIKKNPSAVDKNFGPGVGMFSAHNDFVSHKAFLKGHISGCIPGRNACGTKEKYRSCCKIFAVPGFGSGHKLRDGGCLITGFKIKGIAEI